MPKLFVEIPEEVHKNLKRAALERDTTIKDLVNQLLASFVTEEKRSRK